MSRKNGPSIITNGLVLYLDAANKQSYVSGSTSWIDVSNNNNNGTLTNGPTFNTGSGGSIVFDGNNDYVETGYVFPSSTSYTMAVWAKSSRTGFSNRLMGNADSTVGLTGTDIIWGASSSTNIYIVRRVGSNDSNRDINTNFSGLNVGWHYICVTYDNTGVGMILYVDTTSIATNTTLGFTSSLTFRIGRDGNGSDAFNGNVAIVQIYNRALSASEVLQNYNATKGRFGL